MKSTTLRLRPGIISTRDMHDRLGARVNQSVYAGAIGAVDKFKELFDALAQVRENQSMLKTPEARASEYKIHHNTVVDRAHLVAEQQLDRFMAHRTALRQGALEKAGLDKDGPMGSEIRSALRSMPQKERDEAVRSAFARGDASVISAVQHAPTPVLTGNVGPPFESMFNQYVADQNPELADELEALAFAQHRVQLAFDSFIKKTDEVRDKGAERRAESSEAAAAEANAALQTALHGKSAA